MPVVTLRTLPLPAATVEPMLPALAAAVAPSLGVPADRVFAVHQTLTAFADGDRLATAHGQGTHPPLIDIAAFAGRSDAQIESALRAAAAVVTAALGVEPDNAFVTYTEIARGRVLTGGAVRR